MLRKLFQILIVVSISCVFSINAFASRNDEWEDSDLAKSRFGDLISGPEIKRSDMKNRLVFVTMLGSQATSRNALKTMASLDRKFRKRGLIVIGFNCFNMSHAERLRDLKKANAKFTCYDAGRIEYEGVARKGVTKTSSRIYVPYGVLYGPKGKKLWEGKYPPSFSKASKIVNKHIGRIKSPKQLEREKKLKELLEGEEYDKIKDVVKNIVRFKLGRAISTCQRAAKKDNERGQQAKDMLEKLSDYAQKQLDEIIDDAYMEPSGTIKDLRSFAKTFAGSTFAADAKKQEKKLKADKEFKASLASEKEYQRLLKEIKRFPYPEDYGKSNEDWLAKFGPRFERTKKKIAKFNEKYPESCFAKKLNNSIKEYEEGDDEEEDESEEDERMIDDDEEEDESDEDDDEDDDSSNEEESDESEDDSDEDDDDTDDEDE